MRKKWLIDMSEEPDMMNTTLANGRSLGQLIIGVIVFLAFQDNRKSLKYVNSDSTPNEDWFNAHS